jgi:hypothetical protein
MGPRIRISLSAICSFYKELHQPGVRCLNVCLITGLDFVINLDWRLLFRLTLINLASGTPLGLVWEMEDSSGWKRIEGDFEKF